MDYEKAYKEALERARNLKEMYPQDAPGYEEVFPELAESEDERIRKEIRNFLIDMECKKEWIAYMEKQKEPLGGTFNSYEMAKTFTDGQNYVMKHPERFGLQKPAEWGEEDEKMREHIISDLREFRDCEVDEELVSDYEDEIAWLKSLPLNLKKKNEDVAKLCSNEWSEEDEKMRDLIVAIFEVNHPNGFFKANKIDTTGMRGVHTEEIISWLKSLRPQPHWKPSEEQMEALESAVKLYKDTHFEIHHKKIVSLYEQLKKLR